MMTEQDDPMRPVTFAEARSCIARLEAESKNDAECAKSIAETKRAHGIGWQRDYRLAVLRQLVFIRCCVALEREMALAQARETGGDPR